MAGLLFIISAPSGSGKSTLVSELLKLVPRLEFSVSYTTRSKRGSERDGVEYRFVDRNKFLDMVETGELLEYAEVFGEFYGTARHFLDDARQKGNDLLLDIDVQGAAQVKQSHPEAVSVFIMPPSRKVLEFRLRNRNESERGLSDEVVNRRLHEAKKEIENWPKYDYVVVNDKLEVSVEQLKAVVLTSRARAEARKMHEEEQRLSVIADHCLTSNNVENARIREIAESFQRHVTQF